MRFRLLCAAMLALVAGLSPAQQPPRPVALAGASYGNYEVESIIRNVLSAARETQVIYEKKGDTFPVAAWKDYSLVIIAHSLAKPFTAEEAAQAGKYLEDGGCLLLVSSAPTILAKDVGMDHLPWLGIKRVAWARQGKPCRVLKPGHALLKGVFDAKSDPAWLTATALATVEPRGMEAILGTPEGECLFGIRKVGKGWVAFLGHELFRLRGANSPAREDTPSYIALIRNIVDAAAPLTQAGQDAAALRASAQREKDVLLWNREWQFGEAYGPRFAPPLPEAAEEIAELSADMAVDEFESLQLNVTPLKDLGDARGVFTSDRFPLDRVMLYVQDCPDPIPWPKDPSLAKEFPYWLMPPEHVTPKGAPSFTMPAQKTRILWVRLNSADVAPGRYTLTLTLDFSGGARVAVPIRVTVYPVRLPRKRLITLAPGGAVYGDANNPAPSLRFTKNLAEHGFECSLINALRPDTFDIVGEGAKLDQKYLVAHKARFEAGDYPRLLPAALDAWMEQEISHGLTYVRAGDPTYYLKGLMQRAGFSEKARADTEAWFLRETARYFREKGVRRLNAGIGDEMSEAELRERWLPWARSVNENGWGATTTFTGMAILNPDLNAALSPYVALWTLNRGTALEFTEKLARKEIAMRPGAVLGTYGAGEGRGTEFRKALSRSRFLGWESWMLGIQNCTPNPYFKGWIYYADYITKDLGIGGERFVSYVVKDDPSVPLADSPFLEGIREGMEDGNLCAILSWYLDRMTASGGASAAKAAEVRERLAKLVSDAEGATLRWRETSHGGQYRSRVFESGNPEYRAAKRAVLEWLAEIRDAARVVRPSLYWNDVALVKDGKPVAAIYGGGDAQALAGKAKALCGTDLPVLAGPALDDRYAVAIVLGSGAQNPLAATLLKRSGERDADAADPGVGSYCVREFDDGSRRVLLVMGPDAAGTAKGARLFAMFLRPEGAWLMP